MNAIRSAMALKLLRWPLASSKYLTPWRAIGDGAKKAEFLDIAQSGVGAWPNAGVLAMSAGVMSTAEKLIQSAIKVDSATRASPMDRANEEARSDQLNLA